MRQLPTLVLFLLISFHATRAWATAVSLNPVRVHLSAGKRSEVLLLKNSGSASARFQLSAFAWQESSEGEMKLYPTGDLLFFPSLLEVKPGETRRVRVASTLTPGSRERSYRVVAAELPGPSKAGVVQVLTKLNVPVFVQAAEAPHKPRVTSRIVKGELLVSVENVGLSYFKTESVRVVARSKQGAPLYEHTLRGWYVLAGGRRDYRLQLPKGTCARVESVSATATTENGRAKTSDLHRVQQRPDCG